MSPKTLTARKDAAIWDRVMQFADGLSPEVAREILKLGFSTEDQERMRDLSAKARAGNLDPVEEQEIDTYERVGCLLDIMHSKARRALSRQGGRAG